jgi:hypothetical protein
MSAWSVVVGKKAVEPYGSKAGDKLMAVYRSEFRELDGVVKVIDEALQR